MSQDYNHKFLPIEQITIENIERLPAKPINSVEKLVEGIPNSMNELIENVSDYLFSRDANKIRVAEQYIRTRLAKMMPATGLIQMTTVYHAPECRRDVFMVSKVAPNNIYIGSFNFTD
jgi:hypothetical protein|tara:strand:+ start:892 stop:1245 length:354 start_codon:yes stop_codon:yes gene_type:complete